MSTLGARLRDNDGNKKTQRTSSHGVPMRTNATSQCHSERFLYKRLSFAAGRHSPSGVVNCGDRRYETDGDYNAGRQGQKGKLGRDG